MSPNPLIVRVEDGEFLWSSAGGRVLLTTTTPKLVLNRAFVAGETPEFEVNGVKADAGVVTGTGTDGKFTLDLGKVVIRPIPLAFEFRLLVKAAAVTLVDQKLTLIPPLTGATDPPVALNYSGTPTNPPVAIGTGKLTVFAPAPAGTFLRLQGTAIGSPTLRFFLRLGSDETLEISPLSGTFDSAAGTWDYAFSLGKVPPNLANAAITVRSDFPNGTGHAYLKAALGLTVTASPLALDAPALKSFAATGKQFQLAEDLSSRDLTVYRTNASTINSIQVTAPAGAQSVVLQVDNVKLAPQAVTDQAKDATFANVEFGPGREHVLRAYGVIGTLESKATQVVVHVRAQGPTVEGVSAPGFDSGGATDQLVLKLSSSSQLKKDVAQAPANYAIAAPNGQTVAPSITAAVYDPIADTITLTAAGIKPGSFTLTIPGTNSIVDVYGNPLQPVPGTPGGAIFQTTLATQSLDQLPLPTAGVALQHGPYVPMYEYQTRPPSPNGFNPSDKVESFVVRLYYYRDAHRMAMIVNRSVKSYAAASVEVRQRSAERARDDADKHTIKRKRLQMIAFRAAQDTRAAETELQNAQNKSASGSAESAKASKQLETKQRDLDLARRDLQAATASAPPATIAALQDRVNALEGEVQTLRRVASVGDSAASNGSADVGRLQAKVQALHDAEVKAAEVWQVKELEETRLRANEFRLDVAAATADPITYAPGKPDSFDPVEQVSLSVIGEGLIQLRGPMKGINIIRIMINQIDAPVGQVRIAVHTVQVNGEKGNRMEKVVANVQRYIDHSRFLTAQSSQMLRSAITRVAARKAEEAAAQLGPNCTQEARDLKYLHAFFGKDFIDELALLDSEFLKTGNKLLSLHSMDSTSLSAGLFLMALAKNDIRREIITEFMAMLEGELPQMEFNYYTAGLTGAKCEACCDKKHYLLAYNAKFQSFLGFFNGEIAGNDKMMPLQREFIKLAQIFKAHLVTEITLKQRVLERSLVEERIGGDYREELKKAKVAEDLAKAELQRVQVSVLDATAKSQQALLELQAALDEVEDNLSRIAGDKGIFAYKNQQSQGENKSTMGGARHPVESTALSGTVGVPLPTGAVLKLDFEVKKLSFKGNTPEAIKTRKMLREASDFINQFYFIDRDKFQQLLRAQELIRKAADEDGPMELVEADFETLKQILSSLLDTVKASATNARNQLRTILTLLTEERPEIAKVVVRYRTFRDEMKAVLRVGEKLDTRVRPSFEVADKAIQSLSGTSTSYQAALQKARLLRRPLDEKKLLDLLVDDTEDKFIEQLEGTRAHTANVDNYIKAITTALDDDFNTQFYNPAFRKVREASRLWDVTMGQIETTTVLTNNRSFAKVSPAATMEFDLPKRDIMITEGFKSAKALFDEYGALMNDPSFLALGKLYSGAPSTSQFNTGGGFTAIRNVIPGLPSSPDEPLATLRPRRPRSQGHTGELRISRRIAHFKSHTRAAGCACRL